MGKKKKTTYKKLKKYEYQEIFNRLIENVEIHKKIKLLQNKPKIKMKFLEKHFSKEFMSSYGLKDPRRLCRILVMGLKSNGCFEKIKKCILLNS